MEDADRDVLLDDEHTWSPLLLVVGAALQVVLLMVAFVVMLSVPALTLDALDSAQSVVGTVAWMNGLSSFVASLLAMFIVRRRLRSVMVFVMHSAIPAAVVSSINIVPTYSVRSWVSIFAVIIFATIAAVVSALVYALLLRREDYL
ncbi:hypothetical protein [Actinomyces oris]|jgi:hypothetical protein avisC_03481|uniref:Uncharacterized protein n=1 Tax=Actinomyces oris TaxID=544580 RepID=A0AAW8LD34_9ACTO|nr:hypothetical protein [Actinomyces oris]MDR0177512.1 hypothetical protein [Actinomyces oris]PKY85967.1 hypothetical protein CYJ24_00420 [Actinomyces naeslundii]